MDSKEYERIIVVGNNGSGKSYLSKCLAESLDLPLIHLDLEFWGPNWTPTPHNLWRERQVEFAAGDKWIIDGNHTSVLGPRFERADLIIFLDIHRVTCLVGAIKRLGRRRSDMPEHLQDRFDKEFFRFLWRLWTFDRDRKPVILDLHRKYSDKAFLVIKTRKEMDRLIEGGL